MRYQRNSNRYAHAFDDAWSAGLLSTLLDIYLHRKFKMTAVKQETVIFMCQWETDIIFKVMLSFRVQVTLYSCCRYKYMQASRCKYTKGWPENWKCLLLSTRNSNLHNSNDGSHAFGVSELNGTTDDTVCLREISVSRCVWNKTWITYFSALKHKICTILAANPMFLRLVSWMEQEQLTTRFTFDWRQYLHLSGMKW
jgi:hypothetical protein